MDAKIWIQKIANDNSHGYDQTYRWNERGDYDCSSLVISAWEQAGVPVKSKGGATYTGNMRSAFLKCGFKDVTASVNLATGAGLETGDVLLNYVHHTAMYIGNGQVAQASINEKGTATGGKPGDQTGREIWIRSYYNYPWDCVLRYPENSKPKKTANVPFGINKKERCTGTVTADVLNVRTWAGTSFANIKAWPQLSYGNRVGICSKFHDAHRHIWYYVKIAKKYYGFVDSDYIEVD